MRLLAALTTHYCLTIIVLSRISRSATEPVGLRIRPMISEQRQLDEFLPQDAWCGEVDAMNAKARRGLGVDRAVVDIDGCGSMAKCASRRS